MAELTTDYHQRHSELMVFYAPPVEEHALPDSSWMPEMYQAVLQNQEKLGLERSWPEDALVIATGQQPGLFTGPLYTVYKAITAIHLARQTEERTGHPCIPLFWIGCDDSDFEEVRTAHYLTRNHEERALRYAPKTDVEGLPLFRVPIEDSLHSFVDEMARETTGSEFRESIATFLHESIEQSTHLSDWFARLMARLFRDTPLVIYNPDLQVAREVARPVFETEIRAPLGSTRMLNEAGEKLMALGYGAQVIKSSDECNFFLLVDERRAKVLYRDGQFVLPQVNLSFSEHEMLNLLEESPERFLPNVVSRCMVQQTLFPTLSYVVGPGELAYWGQMKSVFGHFGLAMPAVTPRVHNTLSSIKINKLLNKTGLSKSDLDRPLEELVEQALLKNSTHPALGVLARHRKVLEAQAADLMKELSALKGADDTTGGKKFQEQLQDGLARLEHLLLHNDTAKADATRKQVARLTTVLAPQRKPQERIYTIFSFLFEHGWDLIPRLIRELDIDTSNQHEVEL
jgi:bacillithiol biosynthesis cysteine-adding enzyme BshC